MVTNQDLGYDLGRMPTHPRSGFMICNVRGLPALDADPPRLPSHTAARAASVVAAQPS